MDLPRPHDSREEEARALVRRALTVSRPDMEEIAEMSGLSVHTLWSWHTGRRVPKGTSLKKLANALHQIGEATIVNAVRLRNFDD